MKKLLLFVMVCVLALAGCSTQKQEKKIKVAAHVSPMVDMLEMVKEDLKKDGYVLEVVKVSDNVQANVALNNKEVDANFFQHKVFMQDFNQKNKGNLVVVQPIYDAIVSFYSKKIKNIQELSEAATVAIPADPSNMTRALRLLAEHNIITLQDPNSYVQNLNTIKDNPKKLQFSAVSLLNLNEAYQEKDVIFNYPTYISKLNLKPLENGLIFESGKDLTYAISLVAREDNQDSDAIKALKKAMKSEKIKTFIESKLKGHAKVAF